MGSRVPGGDEPRVEGVTTPSGYHDFFFFLSRILLASRIFLAFSFFTHFPYREEISISMYFPPIFPPQAPSSHPLWSGSEIYRFSTTPNSPSIRLT